MTCMCSLCAYMYMVWIKLLHACLGQITLLAIQVGFVIQVGLGNVFIICLATSNIVKVGHKNILETLSSVSLECHIIILTISDWSLSKLYEMIMKYFFSNFAYFIENNAYKIYWQQYNICGDNDCMT